jgi:hypothetical protein
VIDDRIRDGERIAELLASELTGLETGPLADVAVVDADPGATPSPDGTRAYAVAHRDERIGVVTIYPSRACVRLQPGSLEDLLQAGSLDDTVLEDLLQAGSPDDTGREGPLDDVLRERSPGDHSRAEPPGEDAQTDPGATHESSVPAARGALVLPVESGAGVKRAIDTLRVLLGGD